MFALDFNYWLYPRPTRNLYLLPPVIIEPVGLLPAWTQTTLDAAHLEARILTEDEWWDTALARFDDWREECRDRWDYTYQF